MDVAFFLAADFVNKSENGKLNMLGIFTRIESSKFPAKHRTMYLVGRIVIVPGEYDTEHDFKIIFLDTDGNELVAQEGALTATRPDVGTQVDVDFVFTVGDLLLPKPGRYEFRLVLNKVTMGVIPLDVLERNSVGDNNAPET